MMTRPLFTVVIPTVGRPTLARTLASIDRRYADALIVMDTHGSMLRRPEDVIEDAVRFDVGVLALDAGRHDAGSPQIHMGFHRAAGRYLLNCGDDDVYEPDAFETMASYLNPDGGSPPQMFRVALHPAPHRGAQSEPVVLWDRPEITECLVTGQSFVCANDQRLLGRWVNDWTFMRETVALWGGRMDWREELVCRCY